MRREELAAHRRTMSGIQELMAAEQRAMAVVKEARDGEPRARRLATTPPRAARGYSHAQPAARAAPTISSC